MIKNNSVVSSYLLKLFVLVLLGVWCLHSSSASAVSGYNLIVDDSFQRANTAVGSGANSTTGVGNGWLDYIGNIYKIQNNILVGSQTLSSKTNAAINGLYHKSSTADSFQNGKIRVWTTANQNPGAFVRFNPANGGSSYGMLFNSSKKLSVYKAINGVIQKLVEAVPLANAPLNPMIEFSAQDIDTTHTQLTVNLYNQSDLNTIVATYTYIDGVSPLQTAGYWGPSLSANMQATRVQTYAYVAAAVTPIVGTASITPGSVYKTKMSANISVSGGTAPYSYQWQRSLQPTSGFSNIAGATNLFVNDTNLSPSTMYYYRVNVTDSTPGTPLTMTSNVVSATTMPANGHIIGYLGDSITAGVGSTDGANPLPNNATINDAPAAYDAYLTLQNAGYAVGYNNQGISGSTTADWLPNGAYYTNALASFKSAGVDTVSLMLGTNDAHVGYSASTYQANLTSIVNALLSPGTGITRVILNYPPYTTTTLSGSPLTVAQVNALLLSYEPVIDTLSSTVPGVYQGDTTFYNYFQNNPGQSNDGIHPNQAGHMYLGSAWAQSYVHALEVPTSITATPASTTATITWSTNDAPTSSQVQYGTTTAYGITTIVSDTNPRVMSHSVAINSLSSCTLYHFIVISTDSQNETSSSLDQTFTTTGCTYAFTGPTVGSVGTTSTDFTVTPNASYSGTVTITPLGGGLSTPIVLTFSNSATPQTFTITPTTPGVVTLTSTNSGALNDPSALVYTVNDIAPDAPTAVSATSGNAQATVTFNAPVSNGGSPITGYTVTSFPAGGTDANAGSTSLIHTITGLMNGTSYVFNVTASNSAGTSIPSVSSNSVTPVPSVATFTIIPDASYTGTITFTPSGGSVSPMTLMFNGSSTPQTFTITQ